MVRQAHHERNDALAIAPNVPAAVRPELVEGRIQAPRVLVIGIARIGDTLLLTPVLRAIKAAFPAATLTVMAHPKRRDVLQHFPAIDRLLGMSKQRARWRGWLGDKSYEVALVNGRDRHLLQYAQRVAQQVYCFDEAVYAGIAGSSIQKVPLPTTSIHAVDERLLLLKAWLGEQAFDRRLGFALNPVEILEAKQWLVATDLDHQHPLIGLQVCSFPTKAHRDWPLSHFLELVKRLRAAHPTARFIVLGDALAAKKGAPLKSAFPEHVFVAAGKLNLRQSAAVMACLDVYVGVDTGPTHLAGALGIPMVAMYHHRYPGRNLQPLDHPHCKVLEHPATGEKDLASTGMEAISVEQVFNATQACLGGEGA